LRYEIECLKEENELIYSAIYSINNTDKQLFQEKVTGFVYAVCLQRKSNITVCFARVRHWNETISTKLRWNVSKRTTSDFPNWMLHSLIPDNSKQEGIISRFKIVRNGWESLYFTIVRLKNIMFQNWEIVNPRLWEK
jgi:hypothetical protein